MHRRELFQKAAAATVLGLTGSELEGRPWRAEEVRTSSVPPAATVASDAARYALELEGQQVGLLRSFRGGEPYAVGVANEAAGSGSSGKHITGVDFAPIIIKLESLSSPQVSSWVNALLTRAPVVKSGAIVGSGVDGRETERIEFTRAVLTGVTLSELAASSSEPFWVQLEFKAEQVARRPGVGRTSTLRANTKALQQNAFRVTVDGLGQSALRVVKVDALSFKSPFRSDPVGIVRDPTLSAGPLEISNLRLTLAASGAEPWYDWADDFLIKGLHQNANERSGRLELLTPNLVDVRLAIDLRGLGVVRVASEEWVAGTERLANVTAELYYESATLG